MLVGKKKTGWDAQIPITVSKTSSVGVRFMRAVVISRPGGPDVLEIQTVETPEPSGDYVRVRVRASGINRADLLQRAGGYPAPAGSPSHIPGLEFAGEVDAVGAEVRGWKPGQRVMGLAGGGAQAEYILAHEGLLVEIPANLDFVQAAGIPEVFMTAHDALFTQAGLQIGERVLIHAAGSGVGTAAIQLAHATGATTFGTSRTPEKLEKAKLLGLDIGLSDQQFAAGVKSLTRGEGVHVVLDFIGAAYLEQNLETLASWGRIVFLATMGGMQGNVNIGQLMSKRITMRGVTLRTRTLEEKLAVTRRFATSVLPLLASGQVKPIIDQVYPMERISAAHTAMGENRNFGKLIVTVG
jgi:putative PIG3 family NAD(P)H quinone oxidoreductase